MSLKAIKWVILDSDLPLDLLLCAKIAFAAGFVGAIILYFVIHISIDLLGIEVSDEVFNVCLYIAFMIFSLPTFCLMFIGAVADARDVYKTYKGDRGL